MGCGAEAETGKVAAAQAADPAEVTRGVDILFGFGFPPLLAKYARNGAPSAAGAAAKSRFLDFARNDEGVYGRVRPAVLGDGRKEFGGRRGT